MSAESQDYTIRSVKRALDVLDLLAEVGGEAGISQVSDYLGMYKSTVHRLMSTLEKQGYVQQNPNTGRYRLGLKLVHMGDAVLLSLDIRSQARPFLEQLAETSRETVHLGVLEGIEVVYLDKIQTQHAVQITSRVGKRVPVYCTALGKVHLAYMSDTRRRSLMQQLHLERKTSNTITDLAQLEAHLARVADVGYAVDDEEHEEGVRCLAVPIHNHSKDVVAAVSIVGPVPRMSRQLIDSLIPVATKAGRELSAQLGFRPDHSKREHASSG